ncbi:MAG TPA: ATP-dependent DNA helicase RecG, partial [Prevotella sp.]|nr:ATP-dependent DNA helicase RecG [Prevotella sp.]
MLDILNQDIQYMPGVGPKKKEILQKELGIESISDLLEYYPYKYVDRTHIYRIVDMSGELPFIQIKGRILSFEELSSGRKKRLVAHFSDGTGVVDLVWFSGIKYATQQYKENIEYIVFGKPSVFNGRYQFAHPDIDKAADLQLSQMGMQPY